MLVARDCGVKPPGSKSGEQVSFARVQWLTSLWTVRSDYKLCIHKVVYPHSHDPRDPIRLQTWHINTTSWTSAFNSRNILDLSIVKHPQTRQFLCCSHIECLLCWNAVLWCIWYRTWLSLRPVCLFLRFLSSVPLWVGSWNEILAKFNIGMWSGNWIIC